MILQSYDATYVVRSCYMLDVISPLTLDQWTSNMLHVRCYISTCTRPMDIKYGKAPQPKIEGFQPKNDPLNNWSY